MPTIMPRKMFSYAHRYLIKKSDAIKAFKYLKKNYIMYFNYTTIFSVQTK